MTIAELLKVLLSEPDPSRQIVMAKDGEGNSYSPLSSAHSDVWYVPDSTWSGECPLQEDIDDGVVELTDDSVKVLLLSPTN